MMANKLVFCLFAGLFSHSAFAQDLHLSTGDERWTEADRVAIQGQLKCSNIDGQYSVVLEKSGGIQSLKISVAGKEVPESNVRATLKDISAEHGVDYIAFNCTKEFYRFSFFKANQNSPQKLISSISGKINR